MSELGLVKYSSTLLLFVFLLAAQQVRQSEERPYRREEESGREPKEIGRRYIGIQQKEDSDCPAGAASHAHFRKEQEEVDCLPEFHFPSGTLYTSE